MDPKSRVWIFRIELCRIVDLIFDHKPLDVWVTPSELLEFLGGEVAVFAWFCAWCQKLNSGSDLKYFSGWVKRLSGVGKIPKWLKKSTRNVPFIPPEKIKKEQFQTSPSYRNITFFLSESTNNTVWLAQSSIGFSGWFEILLRLGDNLEIQIKKKRLERLRFLKPSILMARTPSFSEALCTRESEKCIVHKGKTKVIFYIGKKRATRGQNFLVIIYSKIEEQCDRRLATVKPLLLDFTLFTTMPQPNGAGWRYNSKMGPRFCIIYISVTVCVAVVWRVFRERGVGWQGGEGRERSEAAKMWGFDHLPNKPRASFSPVKQKKIKEACNFVCSPPLPIGLETGEYGWYTSSGQTFPRLQREKGSYIFAIFTERGFEIMGRSNFHFFFGMSMNFTDFLCNTCLRKQSQLCCWQRNAVIRAPEHAAAAIKSARGFQVYNEVAGLSGLNFSYTDNTAVYHKKFIEYKIKLKHLFYQVDAVECGHSC
ncbi:unnamed protein product [Malus baccata var. baccata]